MNVEISSSQKLKRHCITVACSLIEEFQLDNDVVPVTHKRTNQKLQDVKLYMACVNWS